MYRKKSDYSLNKTDQDAIVYMDAEGQVVRLTREDFDSEEEFRFWKAWSDEDYHETEKKQHVEDNHTVSFSSEVEMYGKRFASGSVRGSDEESFLRRYKDRFTEKQFRRLWMYCIDKLSEREIAEREGVKQQSVSETLSQTKEKICEILANQQIKHS